MLQALADLIGAGSVAGNEEAFDDVGALIRRTSSCTSASPATRAWRTALTI